MIENCASFALNFQKSSGKFTTYIPIKISATPSNFCVKAHLVTRSRMSDLYLMPTIVAANST
jgi:hypothetical protein